MSCWPASSTVAPRYLEPEWWRQSPAARRAALRLAVWRRDRGRCRLCGRAVALHGYTLDHVRPRRHGGRHTFWNLRVACLPCNNARGSRVRWGDVLPIVRSDVEGMIRRVVARA